MAESRMTMQFVPRDNNQTVVEFIHKTRRIGVGVIMPGHHGYEFEQRKTYRCTADEMRQIADWMDSQ